MIGKNELDLHTFLALLFSNSIWIKLTDSADIKYTSVFLLFVGFRVVVVLNHKLVWHSVVQENLSRVAVSDVDTGETKTFTYWHLGFGVCEIVLH